MESQKNKEGGAENAFARSGRLQRSPVSNLVATASPSSNSRNVLNQVSTPIPGTSTPQDMMAKTKLMEARRKINELHDFIKDKSNVHKAVKEMVLGIKSVMIAVDREQDALRTRAEAAEKALVEAKDIAATAPQETPKGSRNLRSEKRKRETPGEEEEQKKPKNAEVGNKDDGENSGWRTVEKEKWKKRKEKEPEKKTETKKPKPKPRRQRSKGDAIIVEAKDKATYAALFRKVREDPELKELGENVVKARRTQKGEMLFVLKNDPSVKSSAFKELVEKSLGEGANVRALSQETVVECRNLDEITTEEELRSALKVHCDLGEVPMSIRIRKAYGGMQTALIRLSTAASNKLLSIGKVKVGWSVCSLKAIPRISKQLERCFKCMGFGHQARNCNGPDRSDLCRKCGEKGHVARDCTKQPRCLLCKAEEGNDHVTGGFKCPVYKKATAASK